MANDETFSMDSMADELFDAGVVKFGAFTLKTGISSPVYADLRLLVGNPTLLKKISHKISKLIDEANLNVDCLCGVPYGALPVASVVSVEHDLPSLILRKEPKEHGTKNLIEGKLVDKQNCLIIEDVVTTGSSIAETAEVLRAHNLVVTDAVVILDRQQGGSKFLKSQGINLHSVLTLKGILSPLLKSKKITEEVNDEVLKFLDANVTNGAPAVHALKMFSERAASASHPKLKQLYEIMLEKKTNLCVAADFTESQAILNLVSKIGSEICLLKLHADIISDFSWAFVAELKKYSENLKFMIMEDRKFSDTGNTVRLQFNDGSMKISSWAHFVTVHSVAGPGTLDGLHEICLANNVGCLLVAEMSAKNALSNNKSYRAETFKLAEKYSDIVAGFICQKRLVTDPDGFVFMTPGVHAENSSDSLKQKWRLPEEAISMDGNDIIIVGRGVTEAADVLVTSRHYKTLGWQALTGK